MYKFYTISKQKMILVNKILIIYYIYDIINKIKIKRGRYYE